MRLSLLVTRDELAALAVELVPARIDISRSPRRAVAFARPIQVELVPGAGLRIRADARLTWELAGLHVKLAVRSWQVLLRPVIATRANMPVLAFDPVLEHLDFERVPAFLAERVASGINEAFSAQRRKLSWRFAERLSLRKALPDRVFPGGFYGLVVSDAWIAITEDAIHFTVELTPVLERDRAAPRAREAALAPSGTPSSRSARA